jgi:hypothetical protein
MVSCGEPPRPSSSSELPEFLGIGSEDFLWPGTRRLGSDRWQSCGQGSLRRPAHPKSDDFWTFTDGDDMKRGNSSALVSGEPISERVEQRSGAFLALRRCLLAIEEHSLFREDELGCIARLAELHGGHGH